MPAGVVYGGVTPQGFPVVIEVAKDRRQIVRATIGVHLTCTSGMQASFADGYTHVPLSKKGRFNTSFGPNRTTHADGTFDEVQGSMTGVTNAKRTKMSGTWQLTVIEHDAAGAVTDTCDSGKVAWKAKQ